MEMGTVWREEGKADQRDASRTRSSWCMLTESATIGLATAIPATAL